MWFSDYFQLEWSVVSPGVLFCCPRTLPTESLLRCPGNTACFSLGVTFVPHDVDTEKTKNEYWFQWPNSDFSLKPHY